MYVRITEVSKYGKYFLRKFGFTSTLLCEILMKPQIEFSSMYVVGGLLLEKIGKPKMKIFLVSGQSQFSFTSGWLGSY